MAGERATLSNHDEYFKDFYIPVAEAAIASATPLRTMIDRVKNFTGRQIKGMAKLSRGAGIGAKYIPYGSTAKADSIEYTPKALFGTVVLDWEAVVSSGDDKGSFVRVSVDEVETMLNAFVQNEERQFFGDGTGIIASYTAAPTDNGSGSYTVQVTTASWFGPNYEEGYVLDFNTDQASKFEITNVDVTNKRLTVLRRIGLYDPTAAGATGDLYMQFSRNEELFGLDAIADATEGVTSLYGITAQKNWIGRIFDAGDKPLIPDMVTEMVEVQHNERGVTYSAAVTSAKQYTTLVNQLEGKKEYTQLKSKDARYADLGFKGISFENRFNDGFTLVTSRFCKDDDVWFVDKEHMEVRERPRFGWLMFDGNKFLRAFQEGEVPKYKANFGGYEQFFHSPPHLGAIRNLDVPTLAA